MSLAAAATGKLNKNNQTNHLHLHESQYVCMYVIVRVWFWHWSVPAPGTVPMDWPRYENDTRTPKHVFCGQLARCKQLPKGRHKCYKEGLKQNLMTCGISPNKLDSAPLARASQRSHCLDDIDNFEATRVGAIQTKRQAQKTTTIWTTGQWTSLLRSCLRVLDWTVYSQYRQRQDPSMVKAHSVCMWVWLVQLRPPVMTIRVLSS